MKTLLSKLKSINNSTLNIKTLYGYLENLNHKSLHTKLPINHKQRSLICFISIQNVFITNPPSYFPSLCCMFAERYAQ